MLELATGVDSWTPFGDVEVEKVKVDTLLVTVLAVVPTREAVERLFDGWADQMAQPDGVHWVAERLTAAGLSQSSLD